MKVYKLRLRNSDFTIKKNNIWYTKVYDLYGDTRPATPASATPYATPQYTNYSVRKSNYNTNTNLLNDGGTPGYHSTYTGINRVSATSSEIGYATPSQIDGKSVNRFVDLSGRIDLISWRGSFKQPAGDEIPIKLNVFGTSQSPATPDYNSATPTDWAIKQDLTPGELILRIGAFRYAYFGIELDTEFPVDPNGTVEVVISVEIDPPVINGWFEGTRRALEKFPEWMDLREHDPLDVLDKNKATPTTIGGQFVNAIAGEWVTDLRTKISYEEFQRFIESVNLDQKAWVWRTSNVPKDGEDVFSVKYKGVHLSNTATTNEFYEANNNEHAYWLDQVNRELFTLQKYPDGTLLVNDGPVAQEPFHVWNSIDDLGVAVDLFRLPLEPNYSFKTRILDVYKFNPGVSEERFKKSLRRELNLWRYFAATPFSAATPMATPRDFGSTPAHFADWGATPEILTIEDLETDPAYFYPDGNPKPKFLTLVNTLAKRHPMTWGLFKYGEALWDTDGLYHKGFTTISRQFDATPATPAQYQSGVGDINDMYVFDPDFFQPDQTFNVVITARGRKSVPALTNTEIPITATVTGIARESTVIYGSKDNKFHLRVTSGGVTYYANISLSAVYYGGDVDTISLYNATPTGTWPPPANVLNSVGFFDWIGPDGNTSGALQWRRVSDNLPLQGQIALSSITAVDLIAGQKNTVTGAIMLTPTQAHYNAKFVAVPTTLGWAGQASTISATPPYNFTNNDYRIEYKYYDYVALKDNNDGYRSIPQIVSGTINKNDVASTPYATTVGNFDMPTYNATSAPAGAAHKVEIQLSERSSSGVVGAYTKSGVFIPATAISVNGTPFPANGILSLPISTLNPGGTVPLTFAYNAGYSATPIYPEMKNQWTAFKATYTPPAHVGQKINEHGPYRYNQAPQVGNKDNTVKVFNLKYTDFLEGATPLTGDLVKEQITWIGIESVNNPNVLMWSDTNSVIPLVTSATPPTEVGVYPTGALIESVDPATPNTKVLSPLRISAKVKNNLNPRWNPYIHSGWFYEDVNGIATPQYMFAEPQSTPVGPAVSQINLNVSGTPTQAYQGAPIIVYPTATPGRDLRQIAGAFDYATPANNFKITEVKNGTGTNVLYAGYNNISGITVFDITANLSVTLTSTFTASNQVTASAVTKPDHEYRITYKVNESFYTDSRATPGTTKLFFSATPGASNNYIVTWENSPHNPATPVDIPLNPLYSSMEEGFLYIDQDVKDLAYLEIALSPSAIMATPGDFTMVSVYTYDINGNPKPNTTFAVDFATPKLTMQVPPPVYRTDAFGYASFYLDSRVIATSGDIKVNSASPSQVLATPAQAYIDVSPIPAGKQKLSVVMDSNQVLADGRSGTYIFGQIRKADDTTAVTTVYWHKGRDLRSILDSTKNGGVTPTNTATPGQSLTNGRVTSDINGRFSIGPFISQSIPGYWMVSVDTGSAATAGDITYWYEYLNITTMLDPATLQPYFSTQQATPSHQFVGIIATPKYPVTVDEQNYIGATPASPYQNWFPPDWYPISRYDQYQLGLMGNAHYSITAASPRFNDQVES